MNEKKIVGVVFVFLFLTGIILGAVVSNRYYDSEIDRISTAIDDGKEINRRLKLSNTYLSDINRRLTERTGELEKRIIDDNKRYQERLGSISIGLGKISKGLSGTGETIQSIIDGLEEIKKGLREIEKVK